MNTKVTLAGLELDNPVIPASGTFGYGYEFAEIFDLDRLGSIAIKGTTKEPRYGNPLPRIAECDNGLINSVGLQNPGINKVISEELPKLRECFHKPFIANISGFSIEEYVECCEKMDQAEGLGLLEVNISCPNVKHGGMAFGTDPAAAAEVVREVKRVVKHPVFIKLSPNVTDIAAVASACEEAGADGITLINTMLGMRIDLKTGKPILANTTGGYSGNGIFPVALRMVYQVYEAVRIPIIGVGGISSAENVLEMMLAGASAVEIGAANLLEPKACLNIIEALPETMEKYNVNDLKSVIGGAH